MNVISDILFSAVLFLFYFVFVETKAQQEELSYEDNPYWHRVIPDPRGKYQLDWRVDWTRETVEFNVTVETRGYVALGLSRNGEMDSADIVLGGVTPNGKAYFTDRHAIGREEEVPVQDPSQDWVLHSAWENTTHTFVSFSRPLDTCDEHDIPIRDDVLYMLWGYGITDEVTAHYNFEDGGKFQAYLRDPDVTPRIIHESNQNGGFVNRIGNAQRWEVKRKFVLPPKRTTYWATVHKFDPPTSGKKHIIGYNVKMNSAAIKSMHHMMLFRCILPSGVDPTSVYEQFVGTPGHESYTLTDHLGPIPTQFCSELKGGFAIGAKPFFLPAEIGIPIGEIYSTEYYVWVVHYDNSELRTDMDTDIQIDIYYTSELRKFEAGILSVGQHIPGAPSILLPPGEAEHRIYGHCSPSCTRNMLPPEGIKFFAGLLHTHSTGRRIRVQHFRDRRELPWILNDDNFKPSFQPIRLFREEVTVLPGDQVSVQCYFNSSLANTTVIGGYGTNQEMCKTFLFYHQVLNEYRICRSEIISQQFMLDYLAGAVNVTWDQSRLEFMATAPTHLAGMTLSEISDSQYVNWDEHLRAQLQRDHILFPQQEICAVVPQNPTTL